MARRSVGSWVVIIAFGVSGVGHLLNPSAFLWLMPPWLPWHIGLIYLSGVAELLAALGLLARWRLAPAFTVAVLLAVWPANWWFAFDTLAGGDALTSVIAWLRLPLQIPLIVWAWRSPVRPRKGSPGA
jgi:uncharacterized membrane protein